MSKTAVPRVSIITPSFNQAGFLEQTIQSVFSQNYPNLEYWIMDGGSTDGSVDIIKKYAHRLAGWVSEKDRGQADAINKGFARATGEVIAWINSDDYYLPGAIARAVAELQKHPGCSLVYSDVVSVDGAGQPFNVMTYDHWGLDELLQFNILGQPGVFMRRSVLEQSGTLDLSYTYLLDHHLWLRVAQVAPVHYVPEQWAAARFHAGAKNVAHAALFGQEALRIAAWIGDQVTFADRYPRLRRRVWAGAYRIAGRYLLDSGQPGPALWAYLRSLWWYPPIALSETRRIFYAFASLFGNVSWLKQRYLDRRKAGLDRAQRSRSSSEVRKS